MTNRRRFMATLKGENTDRVCLFPLLLCFAADRAGVTYKQYATNARVMAEAQLLVQERFDLDAITVCSDAFCMSADLGGEMVYPDNKSPHLERPLITSTIDLQKLGHPDPTDKKSRMGNRVLAVAEMMKAVGGKVAVLGWVDMPFAEACSVCGVTDFMTLMMDNPVGAHSILRYLTRVVIDFALAQVQVGADMIGAGDAAASLVSPSMYSEFALPYEREVCSAIHDAGGLVKLHICGDTNNLLEEMVSSEADLFNVDHVVPLANARDVYAAHRKCFKGNLDPVAHIMRENPQQCRELARKCIQVAKGTKYMLSAGCEIPAGTPDEVFAAFCDAAKTSQVR